jgi:glycosyltransferase involved in cell wall biosynthesis
MPRSPETKSRCRPVQTVLRAIIKNRPRTPEEFRKAGIKLRYVDHGVFREVYKVQGCPLVVKFPLNEDQDFAGGVQHSVSEVGRIKRLLRIQELKPHLPKVHYHDKKNGVLVMSYYHRMTPERGVELLGKIVQKLVSKIARVQMSDIHTDNIRVQKDANVGRLTFVDLGY